MKHFLAALGGREPYIANLNVERDVLATLLAAEKSSETGSKEPVDIGDHSQARQPVALGRSTAARQ
jgi:hypothetical protein